MAGASTQYAVFSVENVQRIAQENMEVLTESGAFARDAQRWPDSHHDGDYDGMRRFMSERMDFLDNWIQECNNKNIESEQER